MQTQAIRKAFREGARRCPCCGLAFMYHGFAEEGYVCMFPNGKVRWPKIGDGYTDEIGRYHRTKD